MNRILYYIVLLSTCLVLILAGNWLWSSKNESLPPAKAKQLATKPLKSKNALLVKSDLDWEKLSELELRKFATHFENEKSPNGFQLKTIVKPGEAFVTEGYEGRPGEFVFSQLIPIIKEDKNGIDVVEIQVESFTSSISGVKKGIATQKLEMPAFGRHALISLTHDAKYRIVLSTKLEGNPPLISLEAVGSYENLRQSGADIPD